MVEEAVKSVFSNGKISSAFRNLYARYYDSIYHLMPYRKLLWDVYRALDLKPGMKVLDAGCGTGNFELFISEKNPPPIEIEAIDSSPVMLARAQEKCKHLNFITFKPATLDKKLEYRHNSFDRVLCLNAFRILEDPLFAIRELLRVLKPNGRIVMTNPKPNAQFMPVIFDHLKRIKNIWGIARKSIVILSTATRLPLAGITSVLQNQFENSRNSNQNKHYFLSKEELSTLFQRNKYQDISINETYAGQNWSVSADKFQFLPLADEYEAKDSLSSLEPRQIGCFLYKIAEGSEVVLAQEFHHYGYLQVGYIPRPNPNRMIQDGYHKHSTYIIAKILDGKSPRNGQIVGVIRQTHNSSLGFPVINEFELYPEVREELSSIDPNEMVEIGALYTEPGYNVAKGLYSYAWQRSKLLGHKYWLAAIDARLFRAFQERLFFEFRQIGPERFYLGSLTIPAILDCQLQRQHMWEKAPHLAAVFEEAFEQPQISTIIDLT